MNIFAFSNGDQDSNLDCSLEPNLDTSEEFALWE